MRYVCSYIGFRRDLGIRTSGLGHGSQDSRRTGDLGIFEFWDFPFEFQVRQQFKSDRKIINQRASEGFREPQIASKGLRGLQRASWGLREPIFFLLFFISSFFFHFSPTGFESDTILSPTPRDFPGSPGSPFSYADESYHLLYIFYGPLDINVFSSV